MSDSLESERSTFYLADDAAQFAWDVARLFPKQGKLTEEDFFQIRY